jgi:gluconokinase
MPYIIGCDIGTTNVKSVAFDSVSGAILTSHSESYEMQHPQPDWSEQDPGGDLRGDLQNDQDRY